MKALEFPSQLRFDRQYWLTVLALFTLLPLVYSLFYVFLSQVHWLIMGGLTFAVLWILPYRFWPWAMFAVYATRANTRIIWNFFEPGKFPSPRFFNIERVDPVVYVMNSMAEPIVIALAVLLLRRWRVAPKDIGVHDGMLKLHLAALVGAGGQAFKDYIYVVREGSQAEPWLWFMRVFVGHFVGIMLIAPLAAILVVPRFRQGMSPILKDASFYLAPVLAILVTLGIVAGGDYRELLHLLMLVTIIIFTIRHDWRGAAVALFITSLALAIEDKLGPKFTNMASLQTFISISGAMALLFGTALEGLHVRNAELEQAIGKIRTLDARLREATVRNIEAEERDRRLLAANLHDEFGQSLTALQTHLTIAEKTPNNSAAFGTMMQITGTMRRNIRRVLDSLRPISLDELGLYAALDRGSMRQLCETAGIRYEMELHGNARLIQRLTDALQITVYRIVQESVTNVVRHANATECKVRLRITERVGKIFVFVCITDDGQGRADALKAGNGIRGLQDRIISLGGVLHIRDAFPGIYVHAMLEKST